MSISRVLIFLAVIIGLTVGTHYYLWVRLIRDPMWPVPFKQAATVLLVILGMTIPASMLVWRAVPREISLPVTVVGYIWMGAMFLVLVLLWIGDLSRFAWLRFYLDSAVDAGRRLFLARMLGGGAALLGGALTAFSVWEAIRPVDIKQVSIRLRRLPESQSGFRIVQLSDVHIGPTIGRDFLEDVVQKVNELKPDLVAITGDLIDGSVQELGPTVALLGDIRSKYGTFFVTGNHEYYSGADAWISFLSSLGIRTLRNECIPIGEGDTCFDLAGVDDYTAFGRGHGADMSRALAGRANDRPVVLLAHQPRHFDEAREHNVDLQLSGHTHGGQIFPFGALTRLVQPFLAGLHRRGDSQIYVSCGTGYWGPPMRLGAPAEITLIELQPEAA